MSYNRVRRINREVEELKAAAAHYWTIERSSTDANIIYVVFKYSPERDELMDLRVVIEMTATYPFHPPRITFIDKIIHPCLDQDSGLFDLYSNGSDWSPALTLVTTVITLHSVIYLFDPYCAMVVERTNKFKDELLRKALIPLGDPDF
jgi:ubiquitin-protein ligase